MALNRTEQNVGAFISFWAISLLLVYLSLSILGINDEVTMLATMGIDFLCSLCICLLVLWKYRKAQNTLMIDYLNVGTQRYILAILMVMYGVDKILGTFSTTSYLPWILN
jgi:hypothetical protein